uniref:ATP-dependent RNA helicase DDX1 n=1 Tax=Romanomermis culicivorax TaxID=13658 RepID=A0A915L4T7_ROMCU
TDDQSFGYGGTGKKSHKKQFDDYGEAFGLQDTIGCFLDLDSGEITFSRNGNPGKKFPTAFKIPPKLLNSSFFPAVVLKNAEIKFNLGAEKFKFDPGAGFIAVCDADDAFSISSSKHGSSAPAVSHRRQAQSNNSPRCIIIEPSRELAQQTHDQMEKFQKYLDVPKIRSCLIVGGIAAKEQLKELSSGVEIVTGTPGRLTEFIQNGNLDLSQVRFFVLDEADGLLSQGHGDLIRSVHKSIPKVTPEGHRLQMIVCSATLHNFDVKKLADQLMHFPQWVDLKGQDSVPETVHHVVCMIDPRTDKRWINMRQHIETDGIHYNDEIRPGTQAAETLSEAVKILKGDYVVRAIREHNMDQSLIFCRTKLDCDNMEKYLNQQSRTRDEFSCVCLHSDRRPDERKQNLELFKTRKVKFLICTDVAARGIDVHGMPYVINVTLPDDKSNYLHRIGRVGRAERMGLAISLVSAVQEKVWYHQCPNRGKNCYNTKLKDHGGCSIWYNEPSLLAEIEDHLGVTIQQIETDMKVQTDEFDGKVVYGQKKRGAGSGYQGHAGVLAGAVQELAELEKCVQTSYWNLKSKKILTC